ncbi:MAG: hypothetical protein DRJ32_02135 [Thermoprotei archaeon]|nr:MAG: hypothetical protein DRJ32_02135 [Thermoprotei archaeon]
MVYLIVGIFEDEKVDYFYPLTYTRAVYDLRIGMYTLRERIIEGLKPDVIHLFVRDYLAELYRWREGKKGYKVNEVDDIADDILLVNGRLLVDQPTAETLLKAIASESNTLLAKGNDIVALKLSKELAEKYLELFLKPVSAELLIDLKESVKVLQYAEAKLVDYPWDIVLNNAEWIKYDFERKFKGKEWEGEVDKNVVIYGDKANVYVAKGASVEAFTVIDVREGPVYIGENTRVQPGCRIEGPTCIGKDTLIVGGAQIREGSNIGDVCRVGGEFEESVMHGYTNKYHAGFIGHAYIGEWVNLGALTTNSDLKDTYGTVKVTIRDKRVDTGSRKVGCFIGDMVKTSIGVVIYTGKKIGVSAHLHGVVWEDVPSFTIYAKSLGAEPTELLLESAIETQRRMMSRRKKILSKYEIEVIKKIFELTAEERKKAGVKKGRFKL